MIKNNMEYKMYYLTAPIEIVNERSKQRNNGYDRNSRTDTIVQDELKQYEKVISKYKNNVEVRPSQSWQNCEKIATEIFDTLNLTI